MADSKEIIDSLSSERDAMKEAMQEFVNRVDKGEIRSKYTYDKFKKILSGVFELKRN